MKYVISGSRRLKKYSIVKKCIELGIEHFGERPTLIIEGGQRTYEKIDGEMWPVGGVDFLASVYAAEFKIPLHTEKAKWEKYHLAAGPIRNEAMAAMGDVLVAIPDAQSRGTRDMVNAMKDARKPYFVIEV